MTFTLMSNLMSSMSPIMIITSYIKRYLCIRQKVNYLGFEELPLRFAVSVGLGSIVCVPPLQNRRDICMTP